MKADVIIPVYKPDREFIRLLRMLEKQTFPVSRILIMNTEAEGYPLPLQSLPENAEVYPLKPEDFDHGMTRNRGAALSDAEYVLFMTQDAIPADEFLVEHLVRMLESDEQIAAAYARQLPKEGCKEVEAIARAFNYPETSSVRSSADFKALGIKALFLSDVCCMYRKSIFDSLGGFIDRTIFNEDMIYAFHAMKAGFKTGYAADACVYHSHNYTGMQQFHRNFDMAVSQEDHPEVFREFDSTTAGTGKKLVLASAKALLKAGKVLQIPYLVYYSGMKYAGFFLGRRYHKLKRSFVLKCTMNKNYWRKENGTDQGNAL